MIAVACTYGMVGVRHRGSTPAQWHWSEHWKGSAHERLACLRSPRTFWKFGIWGKGESEEHQTVARPAEAYSRASAKSMPQDADKCMVGFFSLVKEPGMCTYDKGKISTHRCSDTAIVTCPCCSLSPCQISPQLRKWNQSRLLADAFIVITRQAIV